LPLCKTPTKIKIELRPEIIIQHDCPIEDEISPSSYHLLITHLMHVLTDVVFFHRANRQVVLKCHSALSRRLAKLPADRRLHPKRYLIFSLIGNKVDAEFSKKNWRSSKKSLKS